VQPILAVTGEAGPTRADVRADRPGPLQGTITGGGVGRGVGGGALVDRGHFADALVVVSAMKRLPLGATSTP
jgi:hypothetical protein